MKNLLFATTLLLMSVQAVAQITFQQGYFIDNNGSKTECYIKNRDWLNNPIEFEYALTDKGTALYADTSSVKEFGIYGESKFVRARVKVDMTPDLTFKKVELSWNTLFLKVLVEGDANLYLFYQGDIRRFFFSVPGVPIEQLIFKRYKVDIDYLKVVDINTYQQQLYNHVNCKALSVEKFKFVRHEKNALVKHFVAHNACRNPSQETVAARKAHFNISPSLGVEFKSLEVSNTFMGHTVDFGSQNTARIGFQAELLLPFNRGKWSVLVDPALQRFQATTNRPARVQYRSLELPVGLRHYFFLSEQTKIFLNAFMVVDVPSKSFVDLTTSATDDVRPRPSPAVGIGIQLSRFSVEARYYKTRNIMYHWGDWESEYSKVALVAAVRLFKI